MANVSCKIKSGMGGSRCGKGRYEGTEILKKNSKKARRSQDIEAVEAESSESPVRKNFLTDNKRRIQYEKPQFLDHSPERV